MAVTMAVGTNWMTEPLRRSNFGQKRFWYSVPAVMPSNATTAGISIGPSAPSPSLPDTTMPTPTKPSASPPHWRAVTFSPSNQPEPSPVSNGCIPTTSAVTPADRPCLIATNTPPR